MQIFEGSSGSKIRAMQTLDIEHSLFLKVRIKSLHIQDLSVNFLNFKFIDNALQWGFALSMAVLLSAKTSFNEYITGLPEISEYN